MIIAASILLVAIFVLLRCGHSTQNLAHSSRRKKIPALLAEVPVYKV